MEHKLNVPNVTLLWHVTDAEQCPLHAKPQNSGGSKEKRLP